MKKPMASWFSCFGSCDTAGASWDRTTPGGTDDPFHPITNVRILSYNEMAWATNSFHPSNKIGRGGFGAVYKGTLKDGTQAAIKSLSAESKQGTTEFLTEIGMVSNVKHPNLVKLLGCCIDGRHRMLVYEYLENNSLASALLGPRSKRIPMDWPRRAAICTGVARGLAFLHEEAEMHIVHRDIKASNILLDRDLNPKIGDFGLAKLFPDSISHISTRVAGTMGYLAPEYALFGQLTKKADVYSFGVLLLEIVSGRSSAAIMWEEDMNTLTLLQWAWNLRDDDRLLEIVDTEMDAYSETQVLHFIKVALVCTQAIAQQRPNMTEVLHMLLDQGNTTPLDVKGLLQPSAVKGGSTHQEHVPSSRGTSAGGAAGGGKGTTTTSGSTMTHPIFTTTRKSSTLYPTSTFQLEPR